MCCLKQWVKGSPPWGCVLTISHVLAHFRSLLISQRENSWSSISPWLYRISSANIANVAIPGAETSFLKAKGNPGFVYVTSFVYKSARKHGHNEGDNSANPCPQNFYQRNKHQRFTIWWKITGFYSTRKCPPTAIFPLAIYLFEFLKM